MTFAEFIATKRRVEDIDAAIGYAMHDEPTPGFVYGTTWHIDADPSGAFVLTLANEGWMSDDLEDLERRLYAYAAREEGWPTA